ncbi:glycerol-3-phosphate transporter permease (plasmid) [Deinococcus aetherius]|uniref:Glycerol-3-phosphate transporter permease n=1 Tax=Deinococcus aetherius TaxID=200252 RepID=A0ABN6RMA8_9DEIO|nr:sugar ABC transporter permease [Deinococcus aetherius]BDP44440.1 glycerol-3-phosphate transporter permease [Deinococcus aetherius]
MTALPTTPPAEAAPPVRETEAAPAFRGRVLPWLFLAPTLAVLALFLYLPAAQTLKLSAYRSNIVLGTQQFVGLSNFTELLSSPVYRQVVGQTLGFVALVVVLGLGLGLGLAWLASRPIRGGRVYRLLLIFPYALSPAVAGTLWLFLFNPEIGAVNQLLGSLFGIRPRWLDDPTLAFGLVTAAAVWKGLGYNVVFYLAALTNLPKEVLEAAEIDGANGAQSFWRVVVPLLSPMTFFLLFTNVVYALFDSFGLVDILTRGGPIQGQAGATTFLIYQLYEDAFRNFRTGLAAAQAVLMLVLVAAITLLQFRFGSRRVHYGA